MEQIVILVLLGSTRLTAKGGGGGGDNLANHSTQILVDLVVEQTMLAIQDLQVKDPRTHHIVGQLDLISMEMLVVMDLVVQSIIMVVAAVLVLLAEMVRQVVTHTMQQVMERWATIL